jgi:hypothetical protein
MARTDPVPRAQTTIAGEILLTYSHNLERVGLGQGVILLQGWVAWDDACRPVLQLHGRDPQGHPWVQTIAFNRDRPDVVAALGLAPALQRCGFFYYAAVPEGQVLELCVHTDNNGARLSLHRWTDASAPVCPASHPVPAPQPSRLQLHLRTWRYFLGRSWSLLRSGQWRGFQERAMRHTRSAWQVVQLTLKPAASALPEATLPWDCLVVDHDLGGGANQYRRHQLAQELLAASGQGSRVALLTFSVLSLQYVVYRILPEQRQELVMRGTWPQLQAWLQHSRIAHIFYNNAVSFPQALPLVQALHDYAQQHACRLTVAMHDYFPICPSQHLLQAEGRYCQLPDTATCQACLSRSDQAMVNLYRHHGIQAWRAAWGQLLARADEVRTFDPSAQTALQRAYPDLTLPMSLRPHAVAPLSQTEQDQLHAWQAQKKRPSGRIGIVGSITSAYKGEQPVSDLVRAIAHSGQPYEVVVLGECAAMPGLPLRSTGPYRASELTALIIQHDIDVFFFSSVGPETFSYVLHELERYQLPVAAFELGAQATFLARYPQGIRLELSDSAEQVLHKLEPYLRSPIH